MPVFFLKFLFFSLPPEFSPVPAGVKEADGRSQNTSQVFGKCSTFFAFFFGCFSSAFAIIGRTSGLKAV